jgi:RNA polymerase sigma-70 factor, ECF subfamily
MSSGYHGRFPPLAAWQEVVVVSNDSDRLLIQEIRKGDARAWESLIARYEGRLLAFVDRRLHDRPASEDVVQETFVGFLNSLPNYDATRELQTYLFTIASHKLTDHMRRKGRHPLSTLPSESDDPSGLADPRRGVSTLARSAERRGLEGEAVARSLRNLVANWQEKDDFLRLKVLELLWVKGWPNREVAAHLGIAEQQVANFRHAAMKKMNESVRDQGLSPDVFPELRPA